MPKSYCRIWSPNFKFWIKLEQFSSLPLFPFSSSLSLISPRNLWLSLIFLSDGKAFAALVAFIDKSTLSSSQVNKMGAKPKSDLKKALLAAEKIVLIYFFLFN